MGRGSPYPGQWQEGHVKGLMVAGGATLDMSWKEGKIVECTVCSPRTVNMVFKYGLETRVCKLEADKSYRVF